MSSINKTILGFGCAITLVGSMMSQAVTQELLFTSAFEGPFNFIAGVYYYRSDADTISNAYTAGPIVTPVGVGS